MEVSEKNFVSKRVISYEIVAFGFIIAMTWIDEVLDIPHMFLGAISTPVNWRESLFESIIMIIVGAIVVNYTSKIFSRMKYLEGLLPICASCKNIRDKDGQWHQIESYIRDRSGSEFSHGICPDCADKLYPELSKNKSS